MLLNELLPAYIYLCGDRVHRGFFGTVHRSASIRSMSESFPREPAPLDAMTEIEVVRQVILQGGASDGESEQLDQILAKLHAKEISPADAIRDAHAILGNRQDYH